MMTASNTPNSKVPIYFCLDLINNSYTDTSMGSSSPVPAYQVIIPIVVSIMVLIIGAISVIAIPLIR